jgi:hypothetical protein
MIDGSTMIVAGVVMQSAVQAHRVIATLRPRLRGPGMLAAITFLPVPHEPVLPGRNVALVAPAPLDR